MSITEDISTIQTIFSPLLGQKAWDVSLGYGSFITLDFGKAMPPTKQSKRTYGEWHLWVYMCVWRLEKNNSVIVGCEDERLKLEKAVKIMEGLAIKSISLIPPAWDTIITFEDSVILRLFSIYSAEDSELWKLFTPGGNVLTIGLGTSWSYEPATTS